MQINNHDFIPVTDEADVFPAYISHLRRYLRMISLFKLSTCTFSILLLNAEGWDLEGWLSNCRCFCNETMHLWPSCCGSGDDRWYFHAASQKGQNGTVSPWQWNGEMLVLEGNLFHSFRGSLAVMNRVSLSVCKNIVRKALMYVRQTVSAYWQSSYLNKC